MRRYESIRCLLQGGTVTIDGETYRADEDEQLKPGDRYIAERNKGPELLTVKEVNSLYKYVVPVETAYPYDLHECVKVKPA